MADPRLNSIHLPGHRREEFRHARQVLYQACGDQTLYAAREAVEVPAPSHTVIRHDDGQPPADVDCWLMDDQFVYPLKVGFNTVGRAPENDVVITDAYVSRRHCAVLVHRDTTCELHDVASKNGTHLNGSKLTGPTPLKPGDRITMSDFSLVFMTRQGGEPAAEVHATLTD